MTAGKGSTKAFDKQALDRIVGKGNTKSKEVPAQQSNDNGTVSVAVKRTSLQISKEIYLEFKRVYLNTYDISLKDFVEQSMKEKIAEEKRKEE